MTTRASQFSEAFSSALPRSNLTVWASFRLGRKQKKCIVNNTGTTRMKLMKLTTLIVPMAAIAATLTFAHGAQAHERYYRRHVASAPRYFNSAPAAYGPWGASAGPGGISSAAGYGGRPRAWCGWQMRQLVGSDPGQQFNLARNWAGWGHAGPAGIGAVVVWPHHVGKIVGEENGQWIVQSGNDGNRMRTRPLSIRGAIAIRWG
jgi:hypothetical protein